MISKTLSRLLIIGGAATIGHELPAQNPGDVAPGRHIVQLKAGFPPGLVAAAHGLVPELVYSAATNGFVGTIPPGRLRALVNDNRVISIVPDRVVAANPRGGNGGGKPGGGDDGSGGDPPRAAEVVPSGVQRVGAIPGILPFTGNGIGVAIVDTGVDFSHPDLNVGSKSFKAVVKGRKMTTSEAPGAGQDDAGHGTHVGGTVGAKSDGFDVVGVAPGVTLFAVKVLDQRGRGFDSTVIAGLDWIAANAIATSPPIRVVNLSLGRPGMLGDNPAYREAVQTLHGMGITIVTSAGNDSDLEVSQQVPATYPEVIAVASSTAWAGESDISFVIGADTASFFTTDGAYNPSTGIGVTVSAPGARQEDIAGGYVTSVGILSTKLGGGTEELSGTSMAAPHVSGAAALLYEQSGTINPESVRAKIMGKVDGFGSRPFDSPTTGYSFDLLREGILDVAGALAP